MSRYIGNNFNGVLFLLREPNSDGKSVEESDNIWISKVLNFEETKNANKYRKSFYSLLQSIGLNYANLPDCAFDNIKPNGGKASISVEYKKFSRQDKAKYAFLLIDEIKPSHIFTCSDIYDAIKQYLIYNHVHYRETNEGIVYRRGKKNKIDFTYNNKDIQIFYIYHPCLGWNIME